MAEMIDFDANEFIPSETDVIYCLESPNSQGVEVNLTAVTFYARLGCKPRTIQHMEHINCTAMTIFNNHKIYVAYEKGKSQHEIYLRTILMDSARIKPALIDDMLSRVVGPAEEDHEAGKSPAEAKKRLVTAADFKFKPLTLENKDDTWVKPDED